MAVRDVTIEEQAANVDNLTFGDDRLGVVFYMRTVEDKERTLTEGRKCFKEREFVRIMVPGDRHNVVDRPVQRTGTLPTDDRMRFPRQYERFQQQKSQEVHDGTPLSLWPQMPSALAEELKYINIYTVEQLAELADTYVVKVPMGSQWKQKAQKFVAAQKDAEVVNKMQAELDARDQRIATLEQAIADQAEAISELRKKVK